MGLFGGESHQKIDEDMEKELNKLFVELDREQDPDRKKEILARIDQARADYRQKKMNKSIWRFFK